MLKRQLNFNQSFEHKNDVSHVLFREVFFEFEHWRIMTFDIYN